jgi:hypothetical protein
MKRRRAAKKAAKRSAMSPTLAMIVNRLGTCVQIQYQDERGRLKTHIFDRGAPLHATREGDHLIISGVRVRDKEIH